MTLYLSYGIHIQHCYSSVSLGAVDYSRACACAVSQMEEIVQKYGMVVITRAGNCPEKFIYENDILTKHKVLFLLFYSRDVFLSNLSPPVLCVCICCTY